MGLMVSGLCEDGQIAAYAVTEPGAVQIVAGISTTCKNDGDYYILNEPKYS